MGPATNMLFIFHSVFELYGTLWQNVCNAILGLFKKIMISKCKHNINQGRGIDLH